MIGRLLVSAALASTLISSALAQPAAPLRLVDAHTHVMVENLDPEDEIARLQKAGLSRVVLMHVDVDSLRKLAAAHPGFVIPSLGVARPTVKGLQLDRDTGPKMARERAAGRVCGFGEIPGFVFSDSPDLDAVYAAAEVQGTPINLHFDLARAGATETLEKAMTAHPKARFVLAHLGWTAGPQVISRLLDAHPNMYTDLSIRFDAVGSLPWRNNGLDLSILTKDGEIPPDWRAVMTRHPDRFLFAMDINSFGPRYTIMDDLIATGRKALAPLPEAVRNAIAYANTERLYGSCRG
ncbi:MAG: hypothetical protein CFE28_08065 [Alphaproteobacteria bacterium PA2]|nr:MAG: hypothetical protein CFE28_08065 [Alphaproteobacteria bacterium PA2]